MNTDAIAKRRATLQGRGAARARIKGIPVPPDLEIDPAKMSPSPCQSPDSASEPVDEPANFGGILAS